MTLSVEEPVDCLGAVPAGDDGRRGAEGDDPLGEAAPVGGYQENRLKNAKIASPEKGGGMCVPVNGHHVSG